MVSRKQGIKYSIASIWQEIARGHEEINGGSGELIFGSWTKPSTEAGGQRSKDKDRERRIREDHHRFCGGQGKRILSGSNTTEGIWNIKVLKK